MIPAIRIENLTYSYKHNWTFKNISVLKDLNLTVDQGIAHGFLGGNGAGKTTTIKCILDLCRAKQGQIDIFGESSINHTARKFVGFLPEQPYWYEQLTVKETLQFYSEISKESSNHKIKINNVAEKVGIEDRLNSKIKTLSKGLTQRVGLAQAIINTPKLLILDEPFSGLDPIGRKEFKDIFLELKRSGTTLFMSSHILSDVNEICDRVSILKDGFLKANLDLSELKSSSSQFENKTLEDIFTEIVKS